MKTLKQRKLIDAHRFATLKDAEAVLGTHGMLIDDHFVADDAAYFKDLLSDWNDLYSEMYSAGEKLTACRSLLGAAQKLEAKGYVIRYGVHTTEDDYQMVTVLFARMADDALCAVKQLFVPRCCTEPDSPSPPKLVRCSPTFLRR